MKKIYYSFSAVILAVVIAFSGISGTYLEAQASSGWTDILWNEDASIQRNLFAYAILVGSAASVYMAPSLQTILLASFTAAEFGTFMLSDGHSQEEVDEIFENGGFIRRGVVGGASGKVNISDEVMDVFVGYFKYICAKNTPYILVKTHTPGELDMRFFPLKYNYDSFKQVIDLYKSSNVYYVSLNVRITATEPSIYIYPIDFDKFSLYFFNIENKRNERAHVMENETWDGSILPMLGFLGEDASGGAVTSNNLFKIKQNLSLNSTTENNLGTINSFSYNAFGSSTIDSLFSSDGCTIKIFNTLLDAKNFSVNRQPYYSGSKYQNYDASVDNSTTVDNSVVNNIVENGGNSYMSDCYNQVVNNITENNITNGISEEQLAQIIDAIVNANNNNGGSGGSSGGDSSGGSGILDMVEGVGKLLDFILSLVGKLVGLISDFLTNVLSMLGNFTAFTDGFGEFLTEAFGFLPPEAIASISLGVTVIVVLAIIKF